MSNPKYSILKVIRRLAGESVDAGYELEVSQELERQFGKSPNGQGFKVPSSALMRDAEFLPYGYPRDTWFDAIGPHLVAQKAGATILAGLSTATNKIPLVDAQSNYWVGGDSTEDGVLTTADNAVLVPHTVGSAVKVSAQLVKQTSRFAENFVSTQLAKCVASGIDKAAFCGTGANGQPKGIAHTTGINSISVTANAPTHANLVEFVYQVTHNDGHAALAWACSPEVAKVLANMERVENGDKNLVEDFTHLCGFPLHITNSVAPGSLVFGDFAELVIGAFGVVDIMVNPMTYANQHAYEVVALADCDICVKSPKAFAVGTVYSA